MYLQPLKVIQQRFRGSRLPAVRLVVSRGFLTYEKLAIFRFQHTVETSGVWEPAEVIMQLVRQPQGVTKNFWTPDHSWVFPRLGSQGLGCRCLSFHCRRRMGNFGSAGACPECGRPKHALSFPLCWLPSQQGAIGRDRLRPADDAQALARPVVRRAGERAIEDPRSSDGQATNSSCWMKAWPWVGATVREM